jgi:hypothetical protein
MYISFSLNSYSLQFGQIFDKPMKEFSNGSMPLIADYLPMLEDMELQLDTAFNDEHNTPIVHATALAALEVIGKYYGKAEECHILRIIVGKQAP